MKRDARRFRDYFIPSESNDFQPYFLRLRFAASLLALIIVIEGLFIAHTLIILPGNNYFAAIFASVLVDETNQSRVTENLGNLTTNSTLEKAAQLKADDMATKGYFAHNSPDGKTPWYWFDQAGYDYAAAGENLAVNFTDSKDVTQAWLASPTHRANIMNANYTEIGIATAHGTYKGKDAIFVVQEFGRPSLVARVSEVASTTESKVVNLIAASETHAQTVTTTKPTAPKIILNPTAITKATATEPELNTSSSSVAGASSEKLPVAVAPVDSPILERSHMNFVSELVASPRATSNVIYIILAAILALALFLNIFVKIRVQHPHLIRNAILLIAVLVALILLNNALGFTQAII